MGNLYGVIGSPIKHSMSPVMHNDLFTLYNLGHHYHAFLVEKEHLKDAIQGMKALNISGFNVTIPHKVEIMKFLDETDDEAKMIGAVNTVVNKAGKLCGYNTDGRGFTLSLQQIAGANMLAKKMLIIGAGGAARGIFVTLKRMGAQRVDIANRTVEKAMDLINSLENKNDSHALSLAEAEKLLDTYEIIINTTSVGMSPNIDDVPIALTNMKKGTILSDIIYNPLETKWLNEGKRKGAIVQNGIGMFVGQGALAFEYWTGISPDLKRMEQKVIEQLGGK